MPFWTANFDFANFTPCEELVPKRHFGQMWNLPRVYFDNLGGLKSVFKFHILICLTCEESVRFRLICEELVQFFSDVKNCFSIFTNVKSRYQFLTHAKNWYSFFTNVKNRYQILTHVKNWYQIITDVKNWYLIFTDINDRICNIQSLVKDSIYFTLSSGINAYQKQIKVISITSEMIWYQTLVIDISLYFHCT